MKRKPVRRPRTPRPYKATLQIERAGVSVFVDDVPRAQLADVIGHVLAAMRSAGVDAKAPAEPVPFEHIGGYAPLEVKDDPYEQGKKPKRVGF